MRRVWKPSDVIVDVFICAFSSVSASDVCSSVVRCICIGDYYVPYCTDPFNMIRFFFSEKSGNIPCLEVGFV